MSTHVELLTSPKNMAEEQSGVTVIIIIGIGLLLFILLFIFAKRQIMRFTLRSRRGPHIQVGLDASKVIVVTYVCYNLSPNALILGT